MEINEIKIAEIISGYLACFDLMQELNIDVAVEFLVMSSTLIPSNGEKDILEDDSLNFLKSRLLEYHRNIKNSENSCCVKLWKILGFTLDRLSR